MRVDNRDPEKLGLAILETRRRTKCSILDAADLCDQAAGLFSERSDQTQATDVVPGSPEQNGSQAASEARPWRTDGPPKY